MKKIRQSVKDTFHRNTAILLVLVGGWMMALSRYRLFRFRAAEREGNWARGMILFFLGLFILLLTQKPAGSDLMSRVKRTNRRLKKAPGSNLLILVEYLYSPATVEEVFKPIVADWRKEFFDALREHKRLKSHFVRVRHLFSFGMAMGLSKALSLIRVIARR